MEPEEVLVSWFFEWSIFVLHCTPFAYYLSYFHLCGSGSGFTKFLNTDPIGSGSNTGSFSSFFYEVKNWPPLVLQDTGVSVRKRVIKILKDICLEFPDYERIPQICVKMIRRINDEEGIRKLVMEVFHNMWFAPISERKQRGEAENHLLVTKGGRLTTHNLHILFLIFSPSKFLMDLKVEVFCTTTCKCNDIIWRNITFLPI